MIVPQQTVIVIGDRNVKMPLGLGGFAATKTPLLWCFELPGGDQKSGTEQRSERPKALA